MPRRHTYQLPIAAIIPRRTKTKRGGRDDADAAQATLSLVLNRRECFSPIEAAAKRLARCAPALYRRIHTAAFTALLLRPAVALRCAVTTVSDIIDAHGIA